MAIIAIRHGATIDKYIGDAIMAFFGDPETLGQKNDAVNCIKMALEMQQRAKKLRNELKRMGVTRPFNIRCGINSGICTVGNFGSENRLDYTAIGNQVNLASRLESMAGEGEVLVSEETMLLTQDSFEFKPNKEIYVKGFSRPIKTFSVMNTKQMKQIKKISLHSKGIDLEINPEKFNDHSLESLREVLAEIENNI